MSDEGQSRREMVAALDPVSGRMIAVQISHRRIRAVGRRGRGALLETARSVPRVLQHPTAVFQGLCREEDEQHTEGTAGWRCYCGIPDFSYSPDGREGRPYYQQLVLVFVNDHQVAYTWRWEPADPKSLGLPRDLGTDDDPRFREQLL